MAGAKPKFRHLSRDSAHRQALLRNLVTSLFTHETISTTWPKAKEAQRMAEKLITLAKKNTPGGRIKAQAHFYKPDEMMPKLYGELRDRYLERPGGYTRVLRIEPLKEDQAPSAILELVDGPKDMRFAITAKTLAKERHSETGVREMTAKNIRKVTQFRPNGEQQLEELVDRLEELEHEGPEEKLLREKRREIGASQKKIYPDRDQRPPRRGGSRAHD